MSKLLSALFATAMLGTTYGAYAGDGACNHAKKDVNAAVATDRMQLASGYPESGANTTGSGNMADDTGSAGNTGSGDATTGNRTNRSGSGASGGTGSAGADATGTGSADAATTGTSNTDNSPSGSGTSGSGASSGDM